jgi:cytidylate kinase
VAPLVPASDAVILETTGLGIDSVVERVLVELRGKGLF